MAVYTYSAEEVQIIVGGAKISGLADGTFVTVSRDEQAYNKVTGADGTTSRSRSGNRAGTITLTLQQTSPANDTLMAYLAADEAADSGVVPVLIKDNSGNSLFASSAAWVQQMPDAGFSKEVSEREWVLDCARIDAFVGGNNSQTGGGS